MPLLPTSNPPPTLSSSSTHATPIPDDFPQNPTSEARGKDAIDAKNKNNNNQGNEKKKEEEKKTADEVEKERLYEERIEEEYAKREGGA